jgi:hypothetical protein
MRNRRVLPIRIAWFLAAIAVTAEAASRFEAHVVDDLSGLPLAARVAVTDVHGKFVEVDGDHAHVDYLQKRWCYFDGDFGLELPPGGVSLEIRRGFETLPLSILGSESRGAPGARPKRHDRLGARVFAARPSAAGRTCARLAGCDRVDHVERSYRTPQSSDTGYRKAMKRWRSRKATRLNSSGRRYPSRDQLYVR